MVVYGMNLVQRGCLVHVSALKKKSLNCLNIWEHWLAPPSTGKAAAYWSSLTLKSPGGYHLSCKQLAEASEEVGVRRAMGSKW